MQQDAFLFHDTIRSNITLHRPDIGAEDIELALLRAGAAFVFTCPSDWRRSSAMVACACQGANASA